MGRALIVLTALALLAVPCAGCKKKEAGPAEKVGAKADDAMKKAGEKADAAAEKIGQ